MSRRVLPLRALVVVAVVVCVVFTMKWLVSRLEPRLTFFPFAGESETPASLHLDYHPLSVSTEDGEVLAAWWMPHADARADVLYFHGNGGNLSLWLPVLAGIHARGLNVLAFDYRGYGRSTGRPTEAGLYRDATAIVQEVRRLRERDQRLPPEGEVPPKGGTHHPGPRRSAPPHTERTRPVIYWGRSLGGAVAAYATSRAPPDGLILESAFVDKAAVIRDHLVLRTLNLLASYRFETALLLRDFHGPTLVMHGDADTVVPYAAGRELFDRLGGTKRFVTLTGGDHNDVQPQNPREYWAPVDELIAHARVAH
jgi:uncharacterized protein